MKNTKSNLLAKWYRKAGQFCKKINKCHLEGRSSVPWKTWPKNNSIGVGMMNGWTKQCKHQSSFVRKKIWWEFDHLWCCHQVFNVLSKHLVFTPQPQVFLFHPIYSAAQLFQGALKFQHLDSNNKWDFINQYEISERVSETRILSTWTVNFGWTVNFVTFKAQLEKQVGWCH